MEPIGARYCLPNLPIGFPGTQMKLTLTSILAVAALGLITAAEAAPITNGRCLVEYHGGVYHDGTCAMARRMSSTTSPS